MFIFISIIAAWLILEYDYRNTLVERYNCESKVTSQKFNYISIDQLNSWRDQWGEDFDRNYQCKLVVTTRYILNRYYNSRK